METLNSDTVAVQYVKMIVDANGTWSQVQNAKLTYNGLEIERSSNTFTINGAEITLKQTNDRSSYFFFITQM